MRKSWVTKAVVCGLLLLFVVPGVVSIMSENYEKLNNNIDLDLNERKDTNNIKNNIEQKASLFNPLPEEFSNKRAPTFDLSVPYIHQTYDSLDDFVGSYACAPTSAVMVLAYYERIPPNPVWVSYPAPGHYSNFGFYISEEYSYNGYTFSNEHTEVDDCGTATGKGAWGYVWQSGVYYVIDNLIEYLELHDFTVSFSHYDETSARNLVQQEIDQGRPLIARTQLTTAGHYVVIVGYQIDASNNFWYRVNDPFGDQPYGNGCWGDYGVSQPVSYSYSQMGLGISTRGLITIQPLVDEYPIPTISVSDNENILEVGETDWVKFTITNVGTESTSEWGIQVKVGDNLELSEHPSYPWNQMMCDNKAAEWYKFNTLNPGDSADIWVGITGTGVSSYESVWFTSWMHDSDGQPAPIQYSHDFWGDSCSRGYAEYGVEIIPVVRDITFYTDPTSGGTITFDSTVYSNGQTTQKADGTYSITANPGTNYVFNHWSSTGGVSVSNPNAQTTSATISADGSLKAWFTYSPPQRTITFYTDPTNGGTITLDGYTYSNGQTTQKPDGTYSIIANPATNYNFNHWSSTGGVSVSNPSSQTTTATITADGTLKAWFDYTPPQRTITFYTDPTNGGTITLDGYTYSNGQTTQKPDGTYSIIANPATNYNFNHWSSTGGVNVSNPSSQTTTATITADGTLKAWFDYTLPNNPPNVPSNPFPVNGASGIPVNTELSWTGGDPDAEDTVTYDVYFGTTNPPLHIIGNQSGTSYNPGTLDYDTTYYWKIVAWDNHGASAVGTLWQFITEHQNSPPQKPAKPSGQTSGESGTTYAYITSTNDPDEDQVFYMWDWGDGTYSAWLGPSDSGAEVSASHSWSEGTYAIKVKAKDTSGAESPWSDPLPITMPYSYNQPILRFLELLFQRFPHAFPILRQLLGY